mgnify:CR=1 FL=1
MQPDRGASGMLFEFADLGFGEHAAVAHQDHAGEPAALPQFLDLIGDRGGIAGVAGINIHRHRTAFGVRGGAELLARQGATDDVDQVGGEVGLVDFVFAVANCSGHMNSSSPG